MVRQSKEANCVSCILNSLDVSEVVVLISPHIAVLQLSSGHYTVLCTSHAHSNEALSILIRHWHKMLRVFQEIQFR